MDLIDSTLSSKVDKITGKGLSTNDYTASDKNKLTNIQPNANHVVESTTNGNIVIDSVEKTVYSHPSSHPATIITEDSNRRFVTDAEKSAWNALIGSTSEPQYIVKDAWSTTGTRTLSENMYKLYIYNTGSADLTFTINNITTTVKSTEEFEDEFDPFTQVIVTATSTFTANALALKAGSPNPKYSAKDFFSGSSNITRTFTGNVYGIVISNDGTSTLTYTLNGITVTVPAGNVSERYFNAFTQVSINTSVPYRACAKSTLGTAITGSTIDVTPPIITASPNGGTFTSAQSVTLTSNEASTIYYTTDGTTPTTSSSVYSTPISVSANTTLKFLGKDSANNIGSVQTASFTINVDSTAPTVSISPTAGTFISTQSVTLTANETATIYYTVDGSTPTISSTVYTAPISVSSTTTIKYFAKDTAGNSNSVQTAIYTIDTAAPTVSISPSAGTFTSSQSVTLTASETATIYYTLDGSAPTTSSTVYSTALSIGSTTTIKYFAKDAAGNSGTVQSATFTINVADTTPPTVTASPNGGLFNATQNVTLTANETATIYYTTDGSTPTTLSSVYSTAIPISATTTLKFFGKDTANNSSSVQTVTFTIDTVAPTITASVQGGTYTSTQSVTLTSNETATIYYTLDGSTPTTSSAVYSTALSISSTTTLKYFGRDAAGNSSTVQTQSYIINAPDTTAPSVTISPAAGTYGVTQSVTLSANETATIYYTMDGSTPTESSTVYSSAISVSATTTIKYFGKDLAGNLSTVQTATFTIDTVAPTPVDTFTVGTPTTSTVPVSWTKADISDVSKYEVAYSTDGTNFTVSSAVINPSSTTYAVNGLTASTLYTLRIVAIDSVNNRSSAVTTTATTDVQSSNTTLSSSYSTTTALSGDVISIPYTITDPDAGDTLFTATYTIDGVSRLVAVPKGSNTWNVGMLSVGAHTLSIQVKDSSEVSSNTLTFNLTVNTQTLVTSVTSGLVNSYNFEALSSGSTAVADSTGTNGMTVSGFTVQANAVADGGIQGDGTGTVTNNSNLLSTAGDYTIFVTYKYRQASLGGVGNHNIFSVASNLNWNMRSSNYQVYTGAITNTTIYPGHLKNEVCCIKVDNVNNQASFYLNGTLVGTYAYTLGANLPRLTLFGGTYTPSSTNSRGYSTFKNALFYNRVLTDTEISTVSNEIKRADNDIYFDTTNSTTKVTSGLVEFYDFVACPSGDANISSTVGYHKMVKSTTSVPTKQGDGSYLGGAFTTGYSRYRSQRSGTFVFKGTKATVANDDFYTIASMKSDGTTFTFGHDIADNIIIKLNSTKYLNYHFTDTASIHTFIATIDDDGTNSTIKLYIDGTLVKTDTVADNTMLATYPTAFTMNTEISDVNTDKRYKILNYRRALTQAEVTKLHSDLMAVV